MGIAVGLSIKSMFSSALLPNGMIPPGEGLLLVRVPALIHKAKSETVRYFTKKQPKDTVCQGIEPGG